MAESAGVSPEDRTLQLGKQGPAFHGLMGVDGKRYSMPAFADKRILILIFSSNRCPTAKAYESRMVALQADYGPRSVQLVAINSNNEYLHAEESYDGMVQRAKEHGYNFPYVRDEDQGVARAYGAVCTFHVFVLDRARRLRYRGRFDDSRIPERVTSNDLRDALDDLLAGRSVREPDTIPFGCSLDFL